MEENDRLASESRLSEKATQGKGSRQTLRSGMNICAISEWSRGPYPKGHHAVRIYIREADDWKIRMEYVN